MNYAPFRHWRAPVDDWFKGCKKKVRQRGPKAKLSDSEVLAFEIVSEFLGIDTEKDLYTHFRCHYAMWFPALVEIHRTKISEPAPSQESCREIRPGRA